MGAWGTQPFDNDDAADFAGELRDAVDADAVGGICEGACHRILTDSPLELGQVAEAIAAAVIVGVAAGADEALVRTPYGPGPHAGELLATLPAVRLAALVSLASAALDRALDPRDNEWFDEWLDSGELDEVQAVLEPVRGALGRPFR